MAYKKIATNITTVGELKGILTNFNNKDRIFICGADPFSVAASEDGMIVFDEDDEIDNICDPEGISFK